MNIRIQKGFTLLEVLLTIALMGILFAILLVAINPTRQLAQSRNLVRQADINEIYEALEYYKISQKNYPSGITGTKTDICDTGSNSINQGTIPTGCIDLRVLVPTYLSAIPKDPSGGLYKLYRNPDNNKIGIESPENELGQSIAINPISTTPSQGLTSCPAGYILVPGNSLYNTNNFCVAKYEMKAVATNDPTVGLTNPNTGNNTIANTTTATTSANGRAIASVASGYPIAELSQITAIDYCSNQNTVSGGALITNAEWMTIARNIEAQLSNWTTGTAASSAIGTGGLYRGHSDNATDLGESKALAAGPDNNGYIATGQSGFSIERRTHTLSNGEIIWDLSGNVWEWTSDTIMGKDHPTGSTTGFDWREYNTGLSNSITNFGTLSRDLIGPSNSNWSSTQNMGQIYSDGTSTNNTTFPSHRGGAWYHTTRAGVFALSLCSNSNRCGSGFGFRCVVR